MELHLSIFILNLILFVGASASSVTPEQTYWNKVMPNTRMPSAIKNSLQFVGNHIHGKPSPFQVAVAKAPDNFIKYAYAATPKEVDGFKKNGEAILLETQMVPGKTIDILVTTTAQSDNKATFLPHNVGDSIPFSSDKFPKTLDQFSVVLNSKEATAMEKTMNLCQVNRGITNEKTYCATSLKGMVSFAKSKLRDKTVNAFSSTPSKSSVGNNGKKSEYSISEVKRLSDYGHVVACHKVAYPYAVFFCHEAKLTSVYSVSLVSNKGMVDQEKVAVCHKDVSWWSPKHVSFQILKVTPQTTDGICHFLNDVSVVWTTKK